MRPARWNGIDGVDERAHAPYWRIGIRHALADAARGYDWPRVLEILNKHEDLVNSSRPGGRARYAPLHQAAHGGAPVPVVRYLLEMGAWRILRTGPGERAVDIAGRRGHRALIPLLTPVYRSGRIARAVLARLQGHFHALIKTYPAGRKPFLRLPDLEPLLELGRERVYFEVPGMFGGFTYCLEDDGTVPRLMVERFSRVLGCDRFEVTPRGCTPVDTFDAASGRPPAASSAAARVPNAVRQPLARMRSRPASDAPALASIRLANGEFGYVELSPAGRCRLAASEVVQLSAVDVVERHRHAEGIKCMSLNRLMRFGGGEETPAGRGGVSQIASRPMTARQVSMPRLSLPEYADVLCEAFSRFSFPTVTFDVDSKAERRHANMREVENCKRTSLRSDFVIGMLVWIFNPRRGGNSHRFAAHERTGGRLDILGLQQEVPQDPIGQVLAHKEYGKVAGRAAQEGRTVCRHLQSAARPRSIDRIRGPAATGAA